MDHKIKDGILSNYLRKTRFKKVTPLIKGNKILDVGCDEGNIIPYLDRNINYTGIDGRQESLDKARKNYPTHKFINIFLTPDNLNKLSKEQFDAILLIAVLEHTPNPIKLLKNLQTILTPEGRIIITSPAKKSHWLLVLLSKIGLVRNDKHEHGFYINNSMISTLGKEGIYNTIVRKRFQLGLNQLWVLQNREQNVEG